MTTTDGDLLTILTHVVTTGHATGNDINQCQTAGLDVLTASRNQYGWTEINSVQSTPPRQLARTQRDRQAQQ